MQLKYSASTYYLAAGVLAFICFFFMVSHSCDLSIYEMGSRDIIAGKNAYTIDYVDGYHYYYSVLFAILIYPLTLLPEYLGNHIWFCFNVFFLYRITVFVARYLNLTILSQKQKLLFFSLSFIFALRFLLFNFRTQQITFCILYLSLEGLQLIFSGKKISGALLLALGINIKILPVVLLPYLLYRREFKASFLVLIFYSAMMILPGFIVGFAHNNMLLASWWQLINPTNSVHTLDVDERSFHSLSTLLATLLVEKVPDKWALPVRRNIMDISYEHLVWVLNITRLVFISFTLYFLRTKPFVSKVSTIHRFVETSYLLLLIPLIFPHQQGYAFIFIMPAVSYIFYCLITQRHTMSRRKFRALTACMVISYLCCNLDFLLGEFHDYYDHFKILTYGALLVIPMLAVCFPLHKSLSEN
jgi:hypothetical protein